MAREYWKRTKKLIREFKIKAHEEELRRALVPLSESFDLWKGGRVSSGEVAELIHEFNRGPARDLFKNYNGPMQDFMLAGAIAHGILDRAEIPGDLLDPLACLIEYCEQEMERAYVEKNNPG
jgi:hypothetical protein